MVLCLHVQGHRNDPNSSNPAHYLATILHDPLFQSAGLLLRVGNVFSSRSLVLSLALGGTQEQSQGMGKTTKDRDCERGPGLLPVTFWHRGVWKGSGRDEEYLNKSGSKLFDSVEQKKSHSSLRFPTNFLLSNMQKKIVWEMV